MFKNYIVVTLGNLRRNKDRIFRLITTRTGGAEAKDFATAPFPLATALRTADNPGDRSIVGKEEER